MIGYLYIDWDGNFVYKTKDYIEIDNLYFWKNNEHMIRYAYRFDTDDLMNMKMCFSKFQALGVQPSLIKEMCQQIGFNLDLILRK